jgi:hypothetical protein
MLVLCFNSLLQLVTFSADALSCVSCNPFHDSASSHCVSRCIDLLMSCFCWLNTYQPCYVCSPPYGVIPTCCLVGV